MSEELKIVLQPHWRKLAGMRRIFVMFKIGDQGCLSEVISNAYPRQWYINRNWHRGLLSPVQSGTIEKSAVNLMLAGSPNA
ncbi:hypothetical protein [Fimbriiglobus ruber]|uniref:hypothetical protein n=1 Tax=Fimbriiglobus ruber TaxID=1908690 RepID=UPI00117AEC5A|nr:hypothetical protein [Fimbriiglobus ruber]